jgi:FkbM family methyltransferase
MASPDPQQPALVELEYEAQRIDLVFPSLEDYMARVIRETGTFYERDVLEAIRASLRRTPAPPGKQRTAIDAGAFVGTHSIYFAKFCGCDSVLAFEANAATFALLQRNIAGNKLDSVVRPVHAALGERSGHAELIHEVVLGNTGSSKVQFGVGELPVVALDELPDLDQLALIKVDVEGAELDVLRGALSVIARHRPLLCIEVHAPGHLLAVLRMLAPHGYRIIDCLGFSPTYLLEASTAPPRSVWRREAFWLLRALRPRGLFGRVLRTLARRGGPAP